MLKGVSLLFFFLGGGGGRGGGEIFIAVFIFDTKYIIMFPLGGWCYSATISTGATQH